MKATVVGAGVVGLSAAVRLAEHGHEVAVLARDLPLETTSAVAAAVCLPYRALPRDAVSGWSRATYAELMRLSATEPESGVTMRWGTQLLRGALAPPWWADAVDGLTITRDVPGSYDGGWRACLPVADMPVYLGWLMQRLHQLDVPLTRTWLPRLPPPSAERVVVNCTGLAARGLADDTTVTPIRGQVVVVEQVGIDEWLIDETTDLTYVVPRAETVVIGGTSQDGEYDQVPDPEIAQAILTRARSLVPALAHARVLAHRVGLRPARPAVRLEAVAGDSGTTVHCYGHGGAGVTLSWGCADDIAAVVDDLAAADRAVARHEAPAH